jgi:CHAT domain-containing protein
MFIGVGGVAYGKTPPASSMLAQATPGLTRGDYYGVDVNELPDLPSTGEEIRSARDILGGSAPELKTGIEGTETEFKSAPLDEFRIIHLAIHGKANPKSPDRAALIFRPDPPQDDGLLEPREILALHLNADLVVLSACDTAVGHLQGEEGIENLARTFLAVGAKSVVSTLWEIDDTYSLFLMKRFYTHLREGMTEATALALSQNDVLNKFGADTPIADWGAFTLLGDGDRVIFHKKPPEVSSK